jgi:hypothetical protein
MTPTESIRRSRACGISGRLARRLPRRVQRTNPVFDWSCTINGKTYSKSFGLTLSAIAVTGITADTTGYTF